MLLTFDSVGVDIVNYGSMDMISMISTVPPTIVRVSESSQKNLMNVSNIGVCFGPTLMRPEEETMATIMDIKFCNLIVEILIENYDKVWMKIIETALLISLIFLLGQCNIADDICRYSKHDRNLPTSPIRASWTPSRPFLPETPKTILTISRQIISFLLLPILCRHHWVEPCPPPKNLCPNKSLRWCEWATTPLVLHPMGGPCPPMSHLSLFPRQQPTTWDPLKWTI